MQLIDYPALQPYGARYANLDGVPLCIVLTLREGARLAGYDPLNLDNLLARAVVDEATEGQGLPFEPGAYRLPVPLRCLWWSEEGLPLWAATAFLPVGQAAKDEAYWHKRAQPGRMTGTRTGNFSIRSTQGRYMERRVPLPNVVCRQWEATAIGDPDEVARLLGRLSFVGKKRTNGFGDVERWEVVSLDAFELVTAGQLTRSLPAEAVHLLAGQVPEGSPAPVGWTPPQWKPALFRPGWWAGTPMVVKAEDWYGAVDEL